MKKRISKQQWEMAIRKAKSYSVNLAKARFVIAQIALEVCDYSHGGRKVESIYSIRKFAEEIEIEAKTLYQWIRVKRLVVDKLPKGVKAKIHNYKYQDLDEVSDLVKDDTSVKEVRDRFQDQLKRDPTEKKFDKYSKHLDAILFNLQRPVLLKDVHTHQLEDVIKKANVILALSKKELELREKFKGPAQDAKRLNIKAEVAKRINAV